MLLCCNVVAPGLELPTTWVGPATTDAGLAAGLFTGVELALIEAAIVFEVADIALSKPAAIDVPMLSALIGVLFTRLFTMLLTIDPMDPPKTVPRGPKMDPSAAMRTVVAELDSTDNTESKNPLKNCPKGFKAVVSEAVGLYEVSTGSVVDAYVAIFAAVCLADIESPVAT